jgi:hypothetical protein
MNKPEPASPALAALSPFVGVWATEGEMKGDKPSGAGTSFTASDRYEWLPGGHFLLHHFDADMPEGKVSGIEVIGCSADGKRYPMHSFDNQGTEGLMHAQVDGTNWRFLGDSLRFTGGFHEQGRLFAGLWEVRPDAQADWQPLMDVRLRRTA